MGRALEGSLVKRSYISYILLVFYVLGWALALEKFDHSDSMGLMGLMDKENGSKSLASKSPASPAYLPRFAAPLTASSPAPHYRSIQVLISPTLQFISCPCGARRSGSMRASRHRAAAEVVEYAARVVEYAAGLVEYATGLVEYAPGVVACPALRSYACQRLLQALEAT
ncbi:hypothetical protein B0T24DRAFT_144303 [Lasiosphaeria ovina]|uniref:Uncharacterized protein n=1 Tax=Lasiosphaeria ovina TaxID=92902 RepID=A0AAE0KLU1_9PEZI|nr:hypothetical protein B0T24DRAFT_144303 [Lasiosphaeria ovina]